MSKEALLLVVMVAWPLIGISLALVLGRRGHDAAGWLLLGALFGPFAVLLALDSVEHDEAITAELIAAPTRHNDGARDVLVGFDGTPGSWAALTYVQRAFGDRIDRLTVANAVPFDCGHMDEREARAVLEEARRTAQPGLGLEIVHGRLSTALNELAHREAYDLLVVGTSAEERSHLLGDAAVDLAQDSSVPVLLVPPPQPGENQ
jgi:nucleotide-binding universal stress UspA family protein